MNRQPQTVFLLVWTGSLDRACALVDKHYPGYNVRVLSHRELREGGWGWQVRALRQLKGQAFIFYFELPDDLHERLLLSWAGILHRCRETVFLAGDGSIEHYRRTDWVRLFPRTAWAVGADIVTFLVSWILLRYVLLFWDRPITQAQTDNSKLDIAYLYPFPLNRAVPGGAMTHIQGFLGGLAQTGVSCEIFSGVRLPSHTFNCTQIPAKQRLFREPSILRYNLYFARQVRRQLRLSGARILYQRHGRFIVAGAILSRWLQRPLILEFNGSEVWMAQHWDPARFSPWLRLCEEVSLASAALTVVVSNALREELITKGVDPSRIIVNPNGVDPQKFHPGCGGSERRKQLGLAPNDVLATFVGTFSYWHGVSILGDAIAQVLCSWRDKHAPVRLRFLLVGDGPLHSEMREKLKSYENTGRVIFAGVVPHSQVASFLDASDILLSPHVPMPDGRPFFGSPTKLFEYMAMGKAIIASKLDQISEVLQHEKTGWLVAPGNVVQLSAALQLVSQDRSLRNRLGTAARERATEQHTWSMNVNRLLSSMGAPTADRLDRSQCSAAAET